MLFPLSHAQARVHVMPSWKNFKFKFLFCFAGKLYSPLIAHPRRNVKSNNRRLANLQDLGSYLSTNQYYCWYDNKNIDYDTMDTSILAMMGFN